ncbi:MAG: T9SS type A sorting domain-containing protein [Ginsengibacter sp.]
MKYILYTFILSFLQIQTARAQNESLINRKWKVEEYSTLFKNDKIVFFSKDSLTNTIDYSGLEYDFFENGTYLTTNSKDTSTTSGTWSISSTKDSAVIDSANFLLIRLDSLTFITRGYSLQLSDTSGTIDTAYTYFTLFSLSGSGPLPVTLLAFTGAFVINKVQLNWSSPAEINTHQFDIEASHDGVHFVRIGTVPAGTYSNLPLNYRFDDVNFYQTGKNYYRLKQVDVDGHSALSTVVAITVNASGQSSISLSPNPASNKIILSLSQPINGKLQLVLTTLAGQQVWSTMLAGNRASTTLYLPALTKGVYVASIINNKGEKIFYNKVVIQ